MDLKGPTELDRALRTLGAVLASRGHHFDLVVAGGSGLMLIGFLDRPTRDVDLVGILEDGQITNASPLPEDLRSAAQDVGRDLGLAPDWLNAGPASLLDLGLPEGFLNRCKRLRFEGLSVLVAGRLDQVHFKLYATVDQGQDSKHFADLELLSPKKQELLQAARWCRTHDPSDAFLDSLTQALSSMGVEVADGQT